MLLPGAFIFLGIVIVLQENFPIFFELCKFLRVGLAKTHISISWVRSLLYICKKLTQISLKRVQTIAGSREPLIL